MADASRQIADMDREFDRLGKAETNAWDRLDALKAELQAVDRDLSGSLGAAERRSLEDRRMNLRLDYVRTDRQIHDIKARSLDLSEGYRTLKGMPSVSREELLKEKASLEERLKDSRANALELSGSVIGRKHHEMETALLQKELALIDRKLGIDRPGSPDDGPELRGRHLADDFDIN